MTDDPAERVARALCYQTRDRCECESLAQCSLWEDHMSSAKAALAELKPGDTWDGLYIEQVYTDSLLENHPDPNQAAEDMRERAAQVAENWGVPPWKEYPKIGRAIRTLPIGTDDKT